MRGKSTLEMDYSTSPIFRLSEDSHLGSVKEDHTRAMRLRDNPFLAIHVDIDKGCVTYFDTGVVVSVPTL